MGIRTLPQHLAVTGALALALLLLALLNFAGAAHAHQGGEDFETGEVVVKLNPIIGVTIEAINADYGTTTLEQLLGSAGIYLLKLPDGSDTETVSDQMENDPRLVYAEPNFIAEVPEGGGRHRARGVSDEFPSTRYAGSALNLSCAAEIGLGKDTTVAVLDTGAQLRHPALKANFEGAARYDFVSDDTNPSDRPVGLDVDGDKLEDELRGHGTHVAGIVDRVAPEAKIMPLRVLDTEGYGNVFLIAEAISYAKRNGADAINLSFSTPGQSELLQDLIDDATEKGVVVTAAAGNDNTAVPHYPAAGEGEEADEDGLLAVTSVDKHEKKSDFASYGPWVDVAAPGNGIRSAFPVNEYASWSGTSMATPFVAGQAALIREVDRSLDADDVEALIRDTARSLDAKNPAYAGMLGAGHADIGGSLEQLRPGACS